MSPILSRILNFCFCVAVSFPRGKQLTEIVETCCGAVDCLFPIHPSAKPVCMHSALGSVHMLHLVEKYTLQACIIPWSWMSVVTCAVTSAGQSQNTAPAISMNDYHVYDRCPPNVVHLSMCS